MHNYYATQLKHVLLSSSTLQKTQFLSDTTVSVLQSELLISSGPSLLESNL